MFTPRHSTSTDARFQKILTNSPIPKSVRRIYENRGVQPKPPSGAQNASGDISQTTTGSTSLQKLRDEMLPPPVLKPGGNNNNIQNKEPERVQDHGKAAAGNSNKNNVAPSTVQNREISTTRRRPEAEKEEKEKARRARAVVGVGGHKLGRRRRTHTTAARALRGGGGGGASSNSNNSKLTARGPDGRDAAGLRRSARSSGPRDYWVLGSSKKAPVYNEIVLSNFEKRKLAAAAVKLSDATAAPNLATPRARDKRKEPSSSSSSRPTSQRKLKTKPNPPSVAAGSKSITSGSRIMENHDYDLSEPEG